MKKRFAVILLVVVVVLINGCATQRQAQIYRQKQGLMLLDNTELKINKKYYHQKYHKHKKVKYYRNKNNYKKR